MMLSDGDIQHFRQCGHLDINPWNPDRLQPSSYDLTLAPYVSRYDPFSGTWTAPEKFEEDLGGNLIHVINSGEFALFSTVETVTLDGSVSGDVVGKSSWARWGLSIETAGHVDAGFSGQLTLELKNEGPSHLILTAGRAIAQIRFYELRTPARSVYGAEGRGSKYMHQTGPTPARFS